MMSQQEFDGIGVMPPDIFEGARALIDENRLSQTEPKLEEPDYANSPDTHQCPNCGNKEGIFATRSSNSIIGPGSNSRVAHFGCPQCGALFVDAPLNRRTPEDINDPTTV